MAYLGAWQTDGPRAVPQAFPYQGSKRILAAQILSLLPTEGIERLVEPFAGSAAIAVAARHYRLAPEISISDVNAPLMELWRMIIDSPHELLGRYNEMWHAQSVDPKAYFREVRKEFNLTHDPALLLYLLARCVKAAVRYNQKGEFSQSEDKRRLGARPSNMEARITSASSLMQGASVSVGSYEEQLLSATPQSVVYLYPPYQGTSYVPDSRYLLGLRREEFVDVLAEAIRRDVSFIVSYDAVTEDNRYGSPLPKELGLFHRNVIAGTSSQGTLHGRSQVTLESLYVSPSLVKRLGGERETGARLSSTESNDLVLF